MIIIQIDLSLGVGREGSDLEYVDIQFSEFTGGESSLTAKADYYVGYPAPDIGVTSFSGTISLNTSAALFQQGPSYSKEKY